MGSRARVRACAAAAAVTYSASEAVGASLGTEVRFTVGFRGYWGLLVHERGEFSSAAFSADDARVCSIVEKTFVQR